MHAKERDTSFFRQATNSEDKTQSQATTEKTIILKHIFELSGTKEELAAQRAEQERIAREEAERERIAAEQAQYDRVLLATFTTEEDLRIYVKALRLIRRRVNPEMSFGEAAALMATNYLGVAARDDEGGIAVELENLIQAFERTYNVRLEVAGAQPAPRVAAVAAPDDAAYDF